MDKQQQNDKPRPSSANPSAIQKEEIQSVTEISDLVESVIRRAPMDAAGLLNKHEDEELIRRSAVA